MRKKENEKGAALILVLGALAALTVFAGAFALLTFTASYESAVWRDSSALEVAARAGLEYCIWAIKSSELYAYEFYEYAGPAPGPVQAYPKDSEIYYKAYNFLAPPPARRSKSGKEGIFITGLISAMSTPAPLQALPAQRPSGYRSRSTG